MELFILQLVVYVSIVSVFYKYSNGFKQTDVWIYCTLKTLPVLSLSLFSHYGTSGFTSERRSLMTGGQLFGAAGDFLLSTGSNGFVLGSVSFAAGHWLYIIYFGAHLHASSMIVIVSCTVYTLVTNYFVIVPHFYRYKLLFWVLIGYSAVLCSGMIVTGSLFLNGSNGADGADYMGLALGYALFVLSDTCIVLRIIGNKADWLHEVILFTYYASQYLIYRSAVQTQANSK